MPSLSRDTWIKFLNNYCIGELKGSDFIARLPEFAPGEEERKWVKKWSAEERYHHKLWTQLMKKNKIPSREMVSTLKEIYDITDDFVNKKDWIGSIAGATIIEHMSTTAAEYLYKYADPYTRRVFKITTGDDLGHLDFDLAQLARAAKTRRGRRKIKQVHKVFFKAFLKWPLHPEVTDREITILNNTYQLHKLKLRRIGITLPNIKFSRNFSFRIKKTLLQLFLGI